ncbi:MAG: threonylcarbamoyl-AMP synthase [Nitrospirae bacterium RBG_16_43_8]|nr:MAG: threonylcarbamoyl-AMP synthase [Nitrospirae bacterium RBG_16_43_8]
MLIKVTNKNLSDILKMAVEILNNGGIVAFPTETFYGLGVKFDNEASLRKLYGLKKRTKEKPMPLIIGDRTLLSMIAVSVNEIAESLMGKFWPGPLTLLLEAKKGLSPYLTADTGRIAVRIPGESAAFYLVREAGFPITATSANPSGMPPAEDADAVIRYFGAKIDMVIDGGRTAGGLPSTIADVTEKKIKIVREGAILCHLLEI